MVQKRMPEIMGQLFGRTTGTDEIELRAALEVTNRLGSVLWRSDDVRRSTPSLILESEPVKFDITVDAAGMASAMTTFAATASARVTSAGS